MRTKLTLSVDKKTIKKAKSLAKKGDTTVSGMFAEFIEMRNNLNDKMEALESLSGLVDADLASEPGKSYDAKVWKKHGW